jgi:hypothetical protein
MFPTGSWPVGDHDKEVRILGALMEGKGEAEIVTDKNRAPNALYVCRQS